MLEKSLAISAERDADQSLRSRLAAAAPRLRPAEQRVVAFLIREGHRFRDLTLSELASNTGVSQSAIVHMCKELGLGGFREFRLLWVQEASKLAAQSRPRAEVFARLFQELAQTEEMIEPSLERAADAISTATHVFILGGEASGLVAELAAESLAIVGRMAVAFRDDDRLAASQRHFKTGSAVIVFSHRGVNRILESAVAKGREQGATIITVTSRPESPLAALAHILVPTAVGDPPGTRHVTSIVRAIQVAVVHALVDAVVARGRHRE